jgi:PhoPQ-activated pathogenicity-related protein
MFFIGRAIYLRYDASLLNLYNKLIKLKEGFNNMSKVILSKYNGQTISEKIKSGAFNALMYVMNINKIQCCKNMITKTRYGYEYCLRNGDVISAINE